MDFQTLLEAITWYCRVYEQVRPADFNGEGAWVRLGKYVRVISENGYCHQFYYSSTEREKQEFVCRFDAWRRGDFSIA